MINQRRGKPGDKIIASYQLSVNLDSNGFHIMWGWLPLCAAGIDEQVTSCFQDGKLAEHGKIPRTGLVMLLDKVLLSPRRNSVQNM